MSAPKKTLIWRGGLVALTGGLKGARARDVADEGPGTPEGTQAEGTQAEGTSSQPRTHVEPQVDTVQSATPSASAAETPSSPVAPPSVPVVATRIMPIESLFPDLAKPAQAKPEQAELAQAWAVRDRLSVWQERGRIAFENARPLLIRHGGRAALYGGFAIVIGALALWPDPESVEHADTSPPVVAQASVEVQPAARPRQPALDPGEVAPLQVGKGLERAAVDALASGDLARAQSLYTQLAAGQPRPSAFSEAARILARRAQGSER